jgi:hypothetical protein
MEVRVSPGITEETGKVATGIIDALKAQPAVLALTLGNLAMLVFIFYALHAAANFRDALIKQQFDYQREVVQLISKCVVPEK